MPYPTPGARSASTTLCKRAPVTRVLEDARIDLVHVFLAEDQILIRIGIQKLLLANGATIAGTAEDATDLGDAILRSGADLALLDIRMPPTHTDEGIRVGVELRRRSPGFPVVILSQYVERLYFDELIAQGGGSAGYLLKDRVFDGARFVHALRAVAAGETVVDPEVVARLQKSLPSSGPLTELTPREYDTLGHMATGISNTEIAERMFITEKAVARHINGIFAKLGLSEDASSSRRVRAVLTYLRH
jgi:DNA-binding NarL/FixJ family response regulator